MRALACWLVLACACGDNTARAIDDAGLPADATADAPPADAPAARGPCLDTPDTLPRPTPQLPCELLPPGLVIP